MITLGQSFLHQVSRRDSSVTTAENSFDISPASTKRYILKKMHKHILSLEICEHGLGIILRFARLKIINDGKIDRTDIQLGEHWNA